MTILGIDTHKHTHAVVALDDLGRHLDAATFGTTDADAIDLIRWATRHGPVTLAGVEGTAATATASAGH